MDIKRWGLLVALLILLPLEGLTCTTAVISGRFTATGRPMLWKVRDTSEYDNHVRRFESPLGYYVGLMNDSDPEGTQVWGGHNSRGFGIMNSAGSNLNLGDGVELKDQEGVVMKLALEQCVTLADFEKLLDELERPMGVASHFGVIDAEGGAAFYEVDNYSWTKFDANESPMGYVLRTNYSATGEPMKGYGYVRMLTAESHFEEVEPGTLTVLQVANDFTRSLRHTLLGLDYKNQLGQSYVNTDDMISRFATSSMILIEGVAEDESPERTTSWIQVGHPFVSPLLPVWTWNEVPEALQIPDVSNDRPTIAELAKEAKTMLYPIRTVEEKRYMYLPLVYNEEQSGLAQQFELMERMALEAIESAKSRSELEQIQQAMIAESLDVLKAVVD